MSTSIASTLDLSSLGFGDGMDDSSIISQLVSIEGAPLTQLQNQATSISSASSTISTFMSDLSTLQTAANALADPTQFNVFSASSTQSQVVATTASGAESGSHTISVSQVAQAQTTLSAAQGTSSTSALGLSGTLAITVGSSTYNVAVSSTDSLADIAASLNASGAPIDAGVVYDGSSYYLEVQGTQTGAASAFSFSETDGGNVLSGLNLTTAAGQEAQDTKAVVDGMAVTSPTTQISGAIPGVTLAVTGPTTGDGATVNVAASATSLQTELQSFVTAYNAVVTAGHADIGYGSTAATNTLLTGDPAIRTSLDELSGLVANQVTGADSTLSSLGAIGLNLNSDGTLSLDTSTLSQAVQSDPTGVEKLLVDNVAQGTSGIMNTISTTIDQLAGTNSAYMPSGTNSSANAMLPSEIQAYQAQNTEISTQETALETRLQAYQTMLQTEFTNADESVNTERTLFSAVGGSGTFM
jgi:flagellar hook-associated protein 2